MSNEVILKVDGIDKVFPGVKALSNVSFELRRGEIHAVVGENGAGKSTLMKILGGVFKEDKGDIFINGEKVDISEPRKSIQLGIGIVYQELNLVPTVSIAENIFLGEELIYGETHFLNKTKMLEEAHSILDTLGQKKLDCRKLVRNLTISQQQIVEIAKALKLNAKILILDEPTAILGQEETNILFEILKNLKKAGVSIIYISHRLEEIFQICDRVTVLRDGYRIETLSLKANTVTKNDIIRLMVGRELGHVYKKAQKSNTDEDYVLEVANLTRNEEFYDISFKLKKGEILGFSGLVGAGRTELVKAIFGLTRPENGKIKVNGKEVKINKVTDAIRHSMGFVPEDRKKEGLVLKESMRENVTLPTLKKYSKFSFIKRSEQKRAAQEYISIMNIKPPLMERKARDFSGGNQQKIVLSKWLMNNPQILILDEPTRGIDVGAKQEIYNLIYDLADQGVSIIIVSSEMEEILGLCDRIIVMHEGRVTAEIDSNEASQELILQRASGIT